MKKKRKIGESNNDYYLRVGNISFNLLDNDEFSIFKNYTDIMTDSKTKLIFIELMNGILEGKFKTYYEYKCIENGIERKESTIIADIHPCNSNYGVPGSGKKIIITYITILFCHGGKY